MESPKGIQHAHTIYMNNLISQARRTERPFCSSRRGFLNRPLVAQEALIPSSIHSSIQLFPPRSFDKGGTERGGDSAASEGKEEETARRRHRARQEKVRASATLYPEKNKNTMLANFFPICEIKMSNATTSADMKSLNIRNLNNAEKVSGLALSPHLTAFC